MWHGLRAAVKKTKGGFLPTLVIIPLRCAVTFRQAGSICVFTSVRFALPLKNRLGIWAEQIYGLANASSPQHMSQRAQPTRVLGGLHPRLARAINLLWQCPPHRGPQGHFMLIGPQGRSKPLHGVHTTACVTQRHKPGPSVMYLKDLSPISEFPATPRGLLLDLRLSHTIHNSEHSLRNVFKSVYVIFWYKYHPRLLCLKSKRES